MFDIINEHIEEIIDKLYDCEVELKAMGNHQFKRHHVYKVTNGSSVSVLKLYYKKKRKQQELLNYQLFVGNDLKMPEILRHGMVNVNHHEIEWMEISYLDGELLYHVIDKVGESDLLQIYKSIGEFIGKAHCIPIKEDSIKDYEEKGIVIDVFKELDQAIDYVIEQELDEEKLILDGIELTKKLMRRVDFNIKRLIHNDLNYRNVIVESSNGQYVFKGVIDFETGRIGHPYSDLLKLYHIDFELNKNFEDAFLEGYKKYQSLSDGFVDQMQIMLLYLGVAIASWAKQQAPAYYYEGIELIKKQMNKFT